MSDPTKKGCGFRPVRSIGPAIAGTIAKDIIPLKTPSAEQSAIFSAQKISKRHGIIKALAGTGKTTALVQLVLVFATRSLSVLCLAFARRDKLALEERCAGKAKVFTSNGAGLGILSSWARKHGKRLDVNNDCAYQMLFQRFREDGLIVDKGDGKPEWKIGYHVLSTVLGLTDKARTVLPLKANNPAFPSAPSAQDWRDLAERFDYEYRNEEWPNIEFYAGWLFTQLASLQNTLTYGVDFAGQVFLPVYHEMRPSITYDRVLVDECQDQSFVNREIARLYLSPMGKMVAVGDENQAIYSWRGADSNAIKEMHSLMSKMEESGPEEFPLTLCRRCGREVIADAQNLVPAIQALPDAPKGTSNRNAPITSDGLFETLLGQKKGLVLCRANAPLVSLCLRLLAKRVPAFLARSNIVSDLLRLIDSLSEHKDCCAVSDMLSALETYEAEKLAKVSKQGQKGVAKAQVIADKAACLRALAEADNVNTCGQLKKLIDELFPHENGKNADNAVMLSTVHGAKGGEADTVYVLSPESKEASIFDEVWSDSRDRDNTLYVCITRAKTHIVYVGRMPTLARFTESEALPEDE